MDRRHIEELLYGKRDEERRFTQDFPVLPDVWIEYAEKPNQRLSLLLTPHNEFNAATLAKALRQRLADETTGNRESTWRANHKGIEGYARILYNESVVLAEFSFWEMLRVALPLTDWWRRAAVALTANWSYQELLTQAQRVKDFAPGHGERLPVDAPLLKRLMSIAGAIEAERRGMTNPSGEGVETGLTATQVTAFVTLFADLLVVPEENTGLLWSISRNRPAATSVYRSRLTVKADAATRLFETKARGIRWAILDTGIDANHPAFAKRVKDEVPVKGAAGSRVTRTYDFLRIKKLLDPGEEGDKALNSIITGRSPADPKIAELQGLRSELRRCLDRGRAIDWDLLEPFLLIPHDDTYIPPTDSHGTHVAGIIAANWPEAPTETPLKEPLSGMCPEIELYDMRVLGEGADEFTIIAALQFIRHQNAHKDLMVIHGANLSLSVTHDVANFACGRTPVCEECERVVASGVVVVTAAGNRGFNKLQEAAGGAMGDYRYISITDPGNADGVITVGSTHRTMPHTYGVSYFSSRGPTGDGRTKPDLVAPGERIDSCSLQGYYETMDGTSMAAPHVSGAAALLISRNRELMGQPRRVKEILVRSATDLGREPRFQGSGNLDVLRALQSV